MRSSCHEATLKFVVQVWDLYSRKLGGGRFSICTSQSNLEPAGIELTSGDVCWNYLLTCKAWSSPLKQLDTPLRASGFFAHDHWTAGFSAYCAPVKCSVYDSIQGCNLWAYSASLFCTFDDCIVLEAIQVWHVCGQGEPQATYEIMHVTKPLNPGSLQLTSLRSSTFAIHKCTEKVLLSMTEMLSPFLLYIVHVASMEAGVHFTSHINCIAMSHCNWGEFTLYWNNCRTRGLSCKTHTWSVVDPADTLKARQQVQGAVKGNVPMLSLLQSAAQVGSLTINVAASFFCFVFAAECQQALPNRNTLVGSGPPAEKDETIPSTMCQ